jgi:hypothetical protein
LAGITAARIWLSVDRAPPYPADARLDRSDLAIIGELDVAGRFRCALGRLDGTRVTTAAHGLDLAAAQLVAYRDDLQAAAPVAAAHDAGGFALAAPLAGDPVYLVAQVDGLPWLVAQRPGHGL